MNLYLKFRNRKFTLPIVTFVVLLIVGVLFRIQHWPYGLELIIIGCIGITCSYSLRILLKSDRQVYDWLSMLLVVLWCIHNILRVMWHPMKSYVLYMLWLSFIAFVVAYLFRRKEKNDQSRFFESSWELIFLVLLAIGTVGSSVLRIQHWPGATLFQFIGLIGLVGWFGMRIGKDKKK